MMYELFTIHVWFSIAGGAVGGVRSLYDSKGEKRPTGEIALDFVISIIAAVSFNSYVFDPDTVSPFVFLGIGVPCGACSRIGLQIIRSGALNYLRNKFDSLLNAAATRIINSQQEKKNDENK